MLAALQMQDIYLLDHLLVVIEFLVVVLLLCGVTLDALASEHADSQTVILISSKIISGCYLPIPCNASASSSSE